MSSHHKSKSTSTHSSSKTAITHQELLNEQLNDWWMATLADTGFMTDDSSESSLNWEYAMEGDSIDIVIEEFPKKKKGSARKERTTE